MTAAPSARAILISDRLIVDRSKYTDVVQQRRFATVKRTLPTPRKALLQMIGSALSAQHRVSGRIAFAEKPDVLWENPELGRLYARLEDECEIIERGPPLNLPTPRVLSKGV